MTCARHFLTDGALHSHGQEVRWSKLILALMWPVVGLADIDAGVEAYKRGEYATAMREWRPLAEAGDVDSRYGLGLMYHKGEGVPQDSAEAVKWFRQAAEQGLAVSET